MALSPISGVHKGAEGQSELKVFLVFAWLMKLAVALSGTWPEKAALAESSLIRNASTAARYGNDFDWKAAFRGFKRWREAEGWSWLGD